MDLMWRSGDLGLFGGNTQVPHLRFSLLLQLYTTLCMALLATRPCCGSTQFLHFDWQSVSEEDDQVRELIHTERLIVKRASGRAIVNK